MENKNFSLKKVFNTIDILFSFEKEDNKKYFFFKNDKISELSKNYINSNNIRQISQYDEKDINCIFIPIGRKVEDLSDYLSLIKRKPSLLIIYFEQAILKKSIFPKIESYGYRIFYEIDNFVIFFFDYFHIIKLNNLSNLNFKFEQYKARWDWEIFKNKKYSLLELDPRRLLNHKRFDIAIKVNYGRLYKLNIAKNWRDYLYTEHIKRITGPGELIREHDGSGKEGLKNFLANFKSLIQEEDKNNIPFIPLSKTFMPIDGSHRIAAGIIKKQKVNCIKFEHDFNINADYKFFLGNTHLQKSCPIDVIEESAIEYCRIKNSVAIAFLFPSISNHDYAVELISKNASVVYKKEIIITPKQGQNLFRQIYLGQPWLSWAKDNKNFINKTRMCFPFMGNMTVILFDDYKVSELRLIKKEIRDFYKIGNHSIHITDSKEETLNASKIIFNKNSLNLIRLQRKFLPNFHKYLFELKSWMAFNGIDPENICIDGSGVISAFGLRECRDLDFLFLGDESLLKSLPTKISCHNQIADNYGYEIGEIIGDPRMHFWYLGVKFCCPEQIVQMKIKRNETKDKKDLILLRQIIPSKKLLLIWKIINSISIYKNYFFARIKDKIKNLIKKFIT